MSAEAAFVDRATGRMYLLRGVGVRPFGVDGDNETHVWRSRQFVFPNVEGFGWMKVSGPMTSPVTVRLFADGVQIHSASVATKNPLRVPAIKGMRWEIEIESEGRVTEVALAQVAAEFAP